MADGKARGAGRSPHRPVLCDRRLRVDTSAVDELLTTTRAVRKRLDLTRSVDRELILECVRLAMQAPTASNAQDWRWVVVTDADRRAAIAEIYRSVGAEYLAQAASTASDPQTRRVYER